MRAAGTLDRGDIIGQCVQAFPQHTKSIARKYENVILAGEGDVRTLMHNNPVEIESMVRNMAETAQMTGGYFMCIGNHIPWNTPPEAIKRYLELSAVMGRR